jgi:predicted transcriptional regulator
MEQTFEENMLVYVRGRLESARGTWPTISKTTGVPYFTITNLVQGKVDDPRLSTIQPLIDYFRAQDQAVA